MSRRPATARPWLDAAERERTAAWLESQQRSSGEIPWALGHKMDPWDHVHAAMGLTVAGRPERARAAFRYLARTQRAAGGWPAERRADAVVCEAQETNHAAYVASGLWHLHLYDGDADFLAEMWPALERAVDFVVAMQLPSGAVAWAQQRGRPWRAPLLAGSASIHGSLVCALRIAARLGEDRPRWRSARHRLRAVLRHRREAFYGTDLPEEPGRYSMDWYYPVLGGAVRGEHGRALLRDPAWAGAFVHERVGCRCVREAPWYTIAETCELVLALHAVGLEDRAAEVLAWTRHGRVESGAYWTGMTHPEREIYPEDEQTTWTAAAVLLADDALRADSRTCDFFPALDGRDLDPQPAHRETVLAEGAPAAE